MELGVLVRDIILHCTCPQEDFAKYCLADIVQLLSCIGIHLAWFGFPPPSGTLEECNGEQAAASGLLEGSILY